MRCLSLLGPDDRDGLHLPADGQHTVVQPFPGDAARLRQAHLAPCHTALG